ncbi:MAG: pyrrolo-quinoline quinone, partial [Hyphomicrobiaceae bacterium]
MVPRRSGVRSGTAWVAGLLAGLVAVALGGCSGGPEIPRIQDLNPFATKEAPLPGKRIPVALAEQKAGLDVSPDAQPIVLPPPQQNVSWPEPGGPASNSFGHLALGASLKRIWSVEAGYGSTSYGRLTASPIVADGRIYTLDTR